MSMGGAVLLKTWNCLLGQTLDWENGQIDEEEEEWESLGKGADCKGLKLDKVEDVESLLLYSYNGKQESELEGDGTVVGNSQIEA